MIKVNKFNIQSMRTHKIHIFSTPKITSSSCINKMNYINIDILAATIIREKDYIIGFSDIQYIQIIKNHMKHPYSISSLEVGDLIHYLEGMDQELLIIEKSFEKSFEGFGIEQHKKNLFKDKDEYMSR